MQKKAAKAKGEAKATIKTRIAEIKKKAKKSKETFDELQEGKMD